MWIDEIYRYPVKSLTPERLDSAVLSPGRALPWDRAFALAQGDAGFDPAAPTWLKKTNFLALVRNPRAAAIRSRFDEAARRLTLAVPGGPALQADPFTPEGQSALGDYLTEFLGPEARGTPKFHFVPGHSFCDHKTQVISLIGLGTLAALEAAVGAPRHRLRFRANLYLDGLAPWEEFSWIGRTLTIGEVRMAVQERIDRCGATSVNPDTAERDANPVKELMEHFGHIELGIFAEVLTPGVIRPGDRVEVG